MTILDISSFTVGRDQSQSHWQADVTLARFKDKGQVKRGDSMQLQVYDHTFEMIIDDIGLSESWSSGPDNEVALTLLSKTALFDLPYAQVIDSLEFESAIYAKDAAEQLLGTSIDWQMVNWLIPANRLSVQSVSPLQAAKVVVAAGGGLIQAKIDGTFRARPKHSVSVINYKNYPTVATIVENDTYQTDSNINAPQYFDAVRIVDIEKEQADRIEFVKDEDNGLKGELFAYPSPWRPSGISLTHTRTGEVGLSYRGILNEEEEQQVEFIEGQATTSYPVMSIVTVQWLRVNLGELTFDEGGTTITAETKGYSLAKIRYLKRSYRYAASASKELDAQVLMNDSNA